VTWRKSRNDRIGAPDRFMRQQHLGVQRKLPLLVAFGPADFTDKVILLLKYGSVVYVGEKLLRESPGLDVDRSDVQVGKE